MTERDIIAQQEAADVRYLMQVGMFVHAYEGAAFAVARVTGYQIRTVHRRAGDIRVLGFGVAQLPAVVKRLQAAGITVRQETDGLWIFTGGDTTEDASLIAPAKPAKQRRAEAAEESSVSSDSSDSLLAEVLGYNLAASTPMAAMLFLSELQQRYGKK